MHPAWGAWVSLMLGMSIGIIKDRTGLFFPKEVWISVFVAALLLLSKMRRHDLIIWHLICLLIGLALGAYRHHQAFWEIGNQDIQRILHSDHPRLLTLYGIILNREDKPSATQEATTSRLIIRADHIHGDAEIQACSGQFLLETTSEKADRVGVGQPLMVTGWLEHLPDALNPGEWSPRSFWRSRGVVAYMDSRHRGKIALNPNGKSIWWRVLREKIRNRCRHAIQKAVPEGRSGLVEALVLGIRENVNTTEKVLFRDTGTLHLLAISGLHLQVVAMFVMWLAGRAGIGLKSAAWIVVITSASYAALVTGGASVTRATLMAMAISASVIRKRPGCFIHRMAMSGFIVLFIKPSDLFDAGAQLSFLGTAGIYAASISWQKIAKILRLNFERHPLETILLVSSMPLFFEDHHKPEPSFKQRLFKLAWIMMIILKILILKLIQALYISSFVWLITSVLVAYQFGSINPIAILVNIPLVPLTSLALILGLAGMMMSGLGLNFIAFPMIRMCGTLMDLCLNVLEKALQEGSATWVISHSSLIQVTGFYLLILFVYFLVPFQKQWVSKCLLWCLPVFWVSLTIVISNHFYFQPPAHLEIEMLAVDHGLSVLIRWPDGQNWLYDCGQMGRPNVGRMVVAPALRARGVKQIDSLFISHADSDHFNGITSLMESGIKIHHVISTANFFQSRQPDALILKDEFHKRNIPARAVHTGDILHSGPNEVAEVRFPNPSTRPGRADNSTSLVLEITAFDMKMILTGDLEGEGLEEYAWNHGQNDSKYHCDIMTAPHHGGLTSNPAWFYQRLTPRLVLSSQGKNRFGMVAGLKSHIVKYSPQSQLRTTTSDGSIRLQWTPAGVLVKGFRDNSNEPWLLRRNPLLERGNTGPAQMILNP
jgi:competence protein ComEC